MHLLTWILGLNVVLGVFAYQDLLRFRPVAFTGTPNWVVAGESAMFTPTETAPLVVVGLAFWMFFRRRHVLFDLPPDRGPGWLVALLLLFSTAVYGWSVYTGSPDLQGFSLIATCTASALLWRGRAAVRVLRVPLILLLFAIPLPAPLLAAVIWSFQCWTASLSGWYLYMLGTPVLVSAEIIRLPTETFQVIEGCSGLRSVVTVTMLAILMVDLFGRHGRHAFALIASAPVVAFLMNSFRVLTLILNPHSKIHSIHTAQGIAVLLGGLTVLYLIDGLLARLFESKQSSFEVPQRSNVPRDGGSPTASAVVVTVSLAVLLAISASLEPWIYPPDYRGSFKIEEQVPYRIKSWRGEKAKRANNDIANVVFYQTINRRYESLRSEPWVIDLFVGVGEHLDRYRSPFSPKIAYPGRGWLIEDEGVRSLDGGETRVDWKLLSSGTRRMVAYQWYEDSYGLLSESLRSFFALDRSPFFRELPSIAIRISTDIPDTSNASVELAHERLEKFNQGLEPQIRSFQRAILHNREQRSSGPAE